MIMALVTDYLEQTARRFPAKAAFVDERRSITFAELRSESMKIADALIDRKYFKQPIAIFLDKSVECIAAFMGVAYSGNFYTPLDTGMPIERIKKIMQTLQPVALITDRQHEKSAAEFAADVSILCYEDFQDAAADEEKVIGTSARVIDTDVLYVLFTSGSTGVPKGVIIPHRGVITYIEWGAKTFLFDSETVFGNQTPFYFSMSILDIFQTLKNGCTMYIVPHQLFSFPIKLLEFVAANRINTLYWVPSALCIVANLRALGKRNISCLRKILFAGEVMPTKQLNMWRRELPDAQFANLFGPTEVTDICNFYIVDRELQDNEAVPIGDACSNTAILILNEHDAPIERAGDELGELCIRGSSLAYGYYNNPEKTAEVFVQNPLNKSYPEIIYRTGDLVRYNERGELVYVCRKDFQIKHMGHRIELGEIETEVSSLEGVDANCCLYDDKRGRIVLFHSGRAEQQFISERLKTMLPDYMLPNRYVHLDSLPMNLNGKIDRTVLKAAI